jgi:hypothetical protein
VLGLSMDRIHSARKTDLAPCCSDERTGRPGHDWEDWFDIKGGPLAKAYHLLQRIGAFDRSQATDQAREIEVKARQRRRAGRPPVIVTAGCGPFCSAKRSPRPIPSDESQRPSLTSMDRFYLAIIVSALLLLLGATGIFVTRTADLMPHARTVGIAGSR